MRNRLVLVLSILGLTMLLALPSAVSANATGHISGAIFTSLENGEQVNANHYADKRDVYLNGGPPPNAPPTAAGLPDGYYYFQVTDPSGKALLSSDPVICREFRAEGGVIAEYVSIGRTYKVGSQDIPCWIDGWENGKHDLGFDAGRGSVTIQLMPYDDTPNRGGVYKVWITMTAWFDGDPNKVENRCGNGCFHGFIPAYSKTDNFKADFQGRFENPVITVRKFVDADGDGVWDAGEPEVGVDYLVDGGGWPVHIEDPNGAISDGYTPYLYYAGMKGTYLVSEDILTGWAQTVAIVDGVSMGAQQSVSVYVAYTNAELHEVVFGNFECFTVDGYKYNDLNGDGDWDEGEPTVAGWTIQLWRNGQLFATTTTDTDGYYSFSVCLGGDYVVEEAVSDGWTATGPTSYTFTAVSGQAQSFSFFNFEWFQVCGYKYDDKIGNGVWDEGDVGISGWTIYLYMDDTLVATTTTDADGKYCFTVTEPGSYRVVEETKDGWKATYPESGEYSFTAVSGEDLTLDFLNFNEAKVCGYKWYDRDMDGVKDSTEPFIEGFKIELYKDGQLVSTAYTDANGIYCFEHLWWGTYTVKEVMPSNPDIYTAWAQTYPSSGFWTITVTSGTVTDDANFGNVVEFTESLTWGYWKTHTGYDSPPRDPTYDLLPTYPMSVDVQTPDGDYLVETDYEAKWVFEGAGSGESPNCSGTCRNLFRAQLLALHLSLLKFDGMAGAIYVNPGGSYDGWTVQDIYDEAIDKLLNGGSSYDFTDFQNILDDINNNHNYGAGSHVLIVCNPPTVVYS